MFSPPLCLLLFLSHGSAFFLQRPVARPSYQPPGQRKALTLSADFFINNYRPNVIQDSYGPPIPNPVPPIDSYGPPIPSPRPPIDSYGPPVFPPPRPIIPILPPPSINFMLQINYEKQMIRPCMQCICTSFQVESKLKGKLPPTTRSSSRTPLQSQKSETYKSQSVNARLCMLNTLVSRAAPAAPTPTPSTLVLLLCWMT